MKNELDQVVAASLRDQIVGFSTLSRLNEILMELEKQADIIRNTKNTTRRPKAVLEAKSQMFALRVLLNDQANILLKLLNKILPDLKSQELPAPTDLESDWMTKVSKSLHERLEKADSSGSSRAKH